VGADVGAAWLFDCTTPRYVAIIRLRHRAIVVSVIPLVQPDDIVAARELLADVTSLTPMLASRVLSEQLGGPVYLKCENLQRTGSFKIRGALVRLSRLSAQERARGVVAASAGNHAQGVALAASLTGAQATVVMPKTAPLPKVQATHDYGAHVVLHGTSVEDALEEALRIAEQTGNVFIHPFDHPDVIAGQGTLGFEIIEQLPQARTILVPAGGGGLLAGLTVAVKSLDPSIKVIGVQAEAEAALPASLAAGHPVAVKPRPTMADGIAVGRPGEIPVGILTAVGDGVLTVGEDSLSRALLLCLERAKQVVEPAGSASVAAILEHGAELEPPVVAVLSGGNIDPLLLSKLLRFGLSAAGRYLSVSCRLPDLPGSLARLLTGLADMGANVLDVSHERLVPQLHMDEAEVMLHVETRGPEHSDEVINKLRSEGYTITFA
jgi:threonine dehydratase